MSAPVKSFGSVSLTRGIRVAVAPRFDAAQSDPSSARYVFVYRIRITNESPESVQLLSRHWVITDGRGERHEVRGEGVVGQQPRLSPGEVYTYSSFCPLPTPWGTMEGEYTMEGREGERFEVQVGRFTLASPGQERA
jgi:ApaG protein